MAAETTTVEQPQFQVNLEEEDLFSHANQKISKSGRIFVTKKAWVLRISMLSTLVFLLIYNISLAITVGDPLIVYSTIMPIHMIAVFVISWFFYRTPIKGDIPNDLVSVIVPVYNQEILITRVIEAIFRSTYPNIEVVAVNDGSKDKSGEILDALAKQNPRLRIVHKLNGGKRTAVAAGFYASKGKYLVLIDSDSIIDEYAIEEFMKTFAGDQRVGGVVGNGKVLNGDKNILTKCQECWYDYAFNIHKTMESTFGTVLCLSGCLAAYRRNAIANFVPFWAEDKAQYGDDRNLTTYVVATPWAKGYLAPISGHLMKSMARYDDSEDRGLTAHTLMNWKTVYVPTAVVKTEVPETMEKYLRQQVRWKKGYLRSTFFVSAFFWRKNPIVAALFYIEFMSCFISPLILFSIYVYSPLFLNQYVFPIVYLGGQMLVGLIAGLDFKFRDSSAKRWMYKPLMNVISATVLPLVLFPALWSFRKNGWLTR